MKTKFVIGMVLTAAFSWNALAANATGKTKMNEAYERYKPVREKALFNGNATSGGLDAVAQKQARDTLVKEMNVSATGTNAIESAAKGADGAKVTDALNSAATEKKLGEKRISENKDVEEAQGFVASADSAVEAISVLPLMGLKGAKVKNLKMNDKDMELGSAAGKALATNVSNLTGSMTQNGRSKYTEIRKEMKRLVTDEKLIPEEASIQAIMNILKVDFETAKKIARKIVSDC